MAKVKGVALLSRMAVIKENYGDEALKAVIGEMKPEYRELLGNVIVSTWYDGEIYKDFNLAIKRAMSAKEPNIMERIGELTADASLKGVYSAQLKSGDARSTLMRTSSLWKMFHDTGELTVDFDEHRNHAVIRITGYALPHEENCRNLMGWGRRMVELSSGAKARISKDKCVCKGDDCCEMAVDWD
jgi:hypothetical protein